MTLWQGAEPGDVFWTAGSGPYGFIIRHGSGSDFGHTGIIVDVLPDGTWRTVEAHPPKVAQFTLDPDKADVLSVNRYWRSEEERQAGIATAKKLADGSVRYAWGELGFMAATIVLPDNWVPVWDKPNTAVCSNVVAQMVRAMRPEDYDFYVGMSPWRVWPGRLFTRLSIMQWDDAHRFEG